MIEKIFVFVFGACLGSFLNVCIYRLPQNMSITKPFSFCPHCKKPIQWFDNIPIISYLVLKARCRSCKGKISFIYPLVELLGGLLLLFLYIRFSYSLNFFKFSFLFLLLIVLSFIDIEYHAIPGYLCFFGVMAGLCFAIYEPTMKMFMMQENQDVLYVVEDFYQAGYTFVKNLIFGFGFAYMFKFFSDMLLHFYLIWRKKDSIDGEKEALGLGDVDFMGMVGVFIGPQLVVVTFFLAPFIALGYSLFALITKRSHVVPYLPYLSMATFISFLWGKNLLQLFNI